MTETQKNSLRIGIIGAGLGGLMAGIAIAEAGGNVIILEAASELGEVLYSLPRKPSFSKSNHPYML